MVLLILLISVVVIIFDVDMVDMADDLPLTLFAFKLGETAKFGLLEIKALKCGISDNLKTKSNSVAYLQVKDISENQNEKVFIFNGWTFSSNPSLTPIDHAIYDIWLVGCENA